MRSMGKSSEPAGIRGLYIHERSSSVYTHTIQRSDIEDGLRVFSKSEKTNYESAKKKEIFKRGRRVWHPG
jgi:hypothetical protein